LSGTDVIVFIRTDIVAIPIDVLSLIVVADILKALNLLFRLPEVLIFNFKFRVLSVKVFAHAFMTYLLLISTTVYLLFEAPPIFIVIVFRAELVTIVIKDNISIPHDDHSENHHLQYEQTSTQIPYRKLPFTIIILRRVAKFILIFISLRIRIIFCEDDRLTVHLTFRPFEVLQMASML
jgi:hypothetical protein